MDTTTLTREDLVKANEILEHSSPREILAWVFSNFDDPALACSFEDLALLHMVYSLRPKTEVIFLDTDGHFPETLEFASSIEREWDLNLTRTTPAVGAREWPCGTARCCELRKVLPLAASLSNHQAWITALKRSDSPGRSKASIISWDEQFGLVKANPLANWSDADVAHYLRINHLATHPLWDQGYASIGCRATTTKPAVPGDRRSGRFSGSDKTECGIHTTN